MHQAIYDMKKYRSDTINDTICNYMQMTRYSTDAIIFNWQMKLGIHNRVCCIVAILI